MFQIQSLVLSSFVTAKVIFLLNGHIFICDDCQSRAVVNYMAIGLTKEAFNHNRREVLSENNLFSNLMVRL